MPEVSEETAFFCPAQLREPKMATEWGGSCGWGLLGWSALGLKNAGRGWGAVSLGHWVSRCRWVTASPL